MRKQTKLAVGLSAAALLVIGASFASMATTRGWVNEGDAWYYYDNSGDMVYDKWKSYNGEYFYLGDDGAMLTNELIEDGDNYYYVDANGAMVKNTWVAIAADDDEEEDVDYRWYYFSSTGKAYKDSTGKTINGKKYGFDEDGKMLFGFVDESGSSLNTEDDAVLSCTYYYGTNDDGARLSGWLRYEDAFDTDEYDDDDYECYWFYFQSNGKKRTSEKKINGYKYNFDEYGVMRIEYDFATEESSDGSVSTLAKYYSGSVEDGSLKKNCWIWAQYSDDWDGDDLTDTIDDDEHWFRTDNQGNLLLKETKKINSKWYVFNEYGRMMHGLVLLDDKNVSKGEPVQHSSRANKTELRELDTDEIEGDDIRAIDAEDEGYLHYFSSSESTDGSMKTGSSIKISLADDDYTFYFVKSSGYGYTGIKSNKVYINGLRLDADSDEKYTVFLTDLDGDGDQDELVLTNTSGTRMKKGSYYKNGDDEYYVVVYGDDNDGFIIYWAEDVDTAKVIKAGSYNDDDEEWEFDVEDDDCGDWELITSSSDYVDSCFD